MPTCWCPAALLSDTLSPHPSGSASGVAPEERVQALLLEEAVSGTTCSGITLKLYPELPIRWAGPSRLAGRADKGSGSLVRPVFPSRLGSLGWSDR